MVMMVVSVAGILAGLGLILGHTAGKLTVVCMRCVYLVNVYVLCECAYIHSLHWVGSNSTPKHIYMDIGTCTQEHECTATWVYLNMGVPSTWRTHIHMHDVLVPPPLVLVYSCFGTLM